MPKWLLFTMVLVLASCGGTTDDAGETDNGSAQADPDAAFNLTVTGGNGEIFDSGRFDCDESFGINGEVLIYDVRAGDATGVPGIVIQIPRDATPGTYDLTGAEDSMGEPGTIEIEYGTRPADSESLVFTAYDMNADGQITLTSVPSQPGERLTGSLTVTLESEEGDTATIEGTFDLALTDFIYDNFCVPDA